MLYTITTRDGSNIPIPDNANILVDSLHIIGDGSLDWNEVYNKNFTALDTKVYSNEQDISLLEVQKVNQVDLGDLTSFSSTFDSNK